MLDSLGTLGIIGALIMLAGIALIATESLVIAAGLALMLAGTGFVVKGLLDNMLKAWGLA